MYKNCIITTLLIFISITAISCSTYFNYNEATRFVGVYEGQSIDDVMQSLGEPESKDRFKTTDGVAEIWIYYHDYLTPCSAECERYYYAPILYLIIENNRVSNVFSVGSDK